MIASLLNFYQRFAARKMFSSWAWEYDVDVHENHYSAADAVAKAAQKALAGRADITPLILIDAGIGTGLVSEQVKGTMACHITGLDFNEDMLALCAAKGVADELIRCDIGGQPWNLPLQSYEAILSAGLFEYLTPGMVQHFLRESAQVLTASGLLIFTYIPSESGKNITAIWHGKSGRYLYCRLDPDWLLSTLDKAGFAVMSHGREFAGSIFQDGSTYSYRLITAQRR